MKKNLLYAAAILGLGFLLMGCQSTSNPRTNPNPAGTSGNTQPAIESTTGTTFQDQSTPGAAALDQSTAGQVNQSLNDLQSTLQSDGVNVNPVDTSGIDQSLNDLQNSLQGTDVPTPAPAPADALDQDLNNLQQTLQSQPAP
jgi:hypothetical protein